MLVDYGYAKIEWGEQVFNLSPTLANIAKLGTPREIIDLFKRFVSVGTPELSRFEIAAQVLNACSDREIPDKLIGYVKWSERKNKRMYHMPTHGMPMFDDCITLATHCLLHGICGKTNKEASSTDTEPVNEFDAYEIMELARVHLGYSRDEAANMTMTEFCRMMDAKFPEVKNKRKQNQAEIDEFNALLEWAEGQ